MKADLGRLARMGMVAALLLGTPACGRLEQLADPTVATPAGESVPTLDVSANAVALLPNSVTSRRVLRVAIPTNEPPTQFYKEGTRYLTGVNPDIARLIGEALGLEVEIKVVNFDSIIPGMAAGRYDMTVSSMTPTDKRIAVIDFVDYMQIGNAIVVAKGQPRLTQEALCGRRVGVLIGSYQLTTNIPDYDTTGRRTGGFADPRIRRNTGSRRRDLGELRLHTRRRRCDQRTPTGERRRDGSRHRHHQWRLPRSARKVRTGFRDDHPGPRQCGSMRRQSCHQ